MSVHRNNSSLYHRLKPFEHSEFNTKKISLKEKRTQVKEDEMGGACSTNGGEKEFI
jgi:hypothetical protein